MDFFQKEAAGRDRVTEAARRWTAAQGEPDQGFAEWYGNTGQDLAGVGHTDAYAAWLASPARIERWAERSGIFVGRGFARWYLAEGRADSFATAYEEYRAMLHAEIGADRKRRTS